MAWLNEHLSRDDYGDECILWPFAKDGHGYGMLKVNGRMRPAHRYILELMTERNPKELNAAHECGNPRCVNPNHLSWKTVAENSADKLRHDTHTRGDRHKLSKLSKSQAIAIFKDTRSQRKIATAYDISDSLVYMIKARKSWAWATKDI